MSTNRFFISFVTIAIVVLIAMRGFGLTVSPRTEVRGNFTTTSTTIHSVNEEKFNEIIDLTSVITYTGTLQGTSTLEGTLTVHRDGTGTFKGVETFTGTIYGKPGTLTFTVTGDNDVYQAIQLASTITSGTGELASLHGVISKTGIIKDNGPVGTYIWQIDQD
jgi:uncharacterized protein DUF3224